MLTKCDSLCCQTNMRMGWKAEHVLDFTSALATDPSVLHKWGVLIVECLQKKSVEVTIDESLLMEHWLVVMELFIPALISARRSWGFLRKIVPWRTKIWTEACEYISGQL